MKDTSKIAQVIATEMSSQNIRQKTISDALGKNQQAMWKPLRENKIKFESLVSICDYLGLEIVVRNPTKNCEYFINRQKK